MGAKRETQRDMLSVKLFFLVLGAIAAYNFNDWLEGEPEWERLVYAPGAFAVQPAGTPAARCSITHISGGQLCAILHHSD